MNESRVLLSTVRPTRFIEMEYHLPRERGPEMVERVMRKLDQRGDLYFPMEYRHIAPDTAWLSPFNAGPRASIAIHAAADERYDYFFTDFEPMYREAGGRPHWGKLHSLGRAELTELYPEYERFLALRAELDMLAPRLPAIRARVEIVHGTQDDLVPVANVAYMRKRLTGATCLATDLLDGQNHFLPWNSEHAVRAAIARALEGAC